MEERTERGRESWLGFWVRAVGLVIALQTHKKFDKMKEAPFYGCLRFTTLVLDFDRHFNRFDLRFGNCFPDRQLIA